MIAGYTEVIQNGVRGNRNTGDGRRILRPARNFITLRSEEHLQALLFTSICGFQLDLRRVALYFNCHAKGL
jgi:hypothetical protein